MKHQWEAIALRGKCLEPFQPMILPLFNITESRLSLVSQDVGCSGSVDRIALGVKSEISSSRLECIAIVAVECRLAPQ